MSTEKDTTLGDLEDCNDVFADLMNVFMFNGEACVGEEDLEQGREKSSYESERTERVRPQYRDIYKIWKKCGVRMAYVGFENQTIPEDDMPFRVIGYDGAAYRDQIYTYKDDKDKRKKSRERYPVVTLVLYMGWKKRWDGPLTLHQALGEQLDPKLKPYVNDYKINLIEVAYLEEQDVKKFKSDFRIVADFLVQMRKKKDYEPEPVQIQHVRELLNTMTALTNDTRYAEAYVEWKEGGEPNTMREFLDKIIDKGREEGHKETKKVISLLLSEGRYDDVERAMNDESYFNSLLSELRTGAIAVN